MKIVNFIEANENCKDEQVSKQELTDLLPAMIVAKRLWCILYQIKKLNKDMELITISLDSSFPLKYDINDRVDEGELLNFCLRIVVPSFDY